MKTSKKEVTNSIELLYNLLFACYYLPQFYDQRMEFINRPETGLGLIIEIIIVTIIYFTVAYMIIGLLYRKNRINDERDTLIELKMYRLAYYLYQSFILIFLFSLFAVTITEKSILTKEDIIFYLLTGLIVIAMIKSITHIILYRTT